MLSPALSQTLRLVVAGCLMSSCAPGPAAAQDHASDQGRVSQIDWRENFYGIRAEGSQGTRLEIRFEPGLKVRASAVLIQQTSTWTATTSECPRLTAALEAFRQLPPLKPGPGALQPNLPREIPVPPRPLDVYIGDAHSHPNGNPLPSEKDWTFFIRNNNLARSTYGRTSETFYMYVTTVGADGQPDKTYVYQDGPRAVGSPDPPIPTETGPEVNPDAQPCP